MIIQQRLCHIKDSWLGKKAAEIQGFADKNDMNSGLKEIYKSTTSSTFPLLSIQETTLTTNRDDILKRWTEPFYSLLNHPTAINNNAINWLPHISTNEALDILPMQEALLQASSLVVKHPAQTTS